MHKSAIEKVVGDKTLQGWIEELSKRSVEEIKALDIAKVHWRALETTDQTHNVIVDAALRRKEFLARLRLELEVGP